MPRDVPRAVTAFGPSLTGMKGTEQEAFECIDLRLPLGRKHKEGDNPSALEGRLSKTTYICALLTALIIGWRREVNAVARVVTSPTARV